MTPESSARLEAIEVDLLLEGVHRHYGLDLRSCSRAALLQRLRICARSAGLPSLSALQAEVLHQPERMEALLESLTAPAAPLFADPEFYLALRSRVVPLLKTHPSVRIWHVGCGSGEETYALAMLLHEEGLWRTTRIYASDASAAALERASVGRYSLPGAEAEASYRRAGGRGEPGLYLERCGTEVAMAPTLRERIFFTQHHLHTDGPLNEFQLIVCRDVLLQFKRSAHDRIHARLFESLARFGFLALGSRESIRGTPHSDCYEELDGAHRLYRRIA